MSRSRVPSYRLHRPSGQAVVTLRTAEGERRDVYLGAHNSAESKREYARIIAEMVASSTSIAPDVRASGSALTVDQMLLAFWRHAERTVRSRGGNSPLQGLECQRAELTSRQI